MKKYAVTVTLPKGKTQEFEVEAPSTWTAKQRAMDLAGKFPYEVQEVT